MIDPSASISGDAKTDRNVDIGEKLAFDILSRAIKLSAAITQENDTLEKEAIFKPRREVQEKKPLMKIIRVLKKFVSDLFRSNKL